MAEKEALVKNAGDPEQVENAKKSQGFKRDDELNDIRMVLNTQAGRRFVWRILEKCGVHRSIWSQSALIHYNSGQQDLGHYIESEIVEADENLLFLMMTENRRRKKNG